MWTCPHSWRWATSAPPPSRLCGSSATSSSTESAQCSSAPRRWVRKHLHLFPFRTQHRPLEACHSYMYQPPTLTHVAIPQLCFCSCVTLHSQSTSCVRNPFSNLFCITRRHGRLCEHCSGALLRRSAALLLRHQVSGVPPAGHCHGRRHASHGWPPHLRALHVHQGMPPPHPLRIFAFASFFWASTSLQFQNAITGQVQ